MSLTIFELIELICSCIVIGLIVLILQWRTRVPIWFFTATVSPRDDKETYFLYTIYIVVIVLAIISIQVNGILSRVIFVLFFSSVSDFSVFPFKWN